MADENQNPGHKWRKVDSDGDGDRHFDSYRFTPYTTDLEFYRDPDIYETEVDRTTQAENGDAAFLDRDKPRGLRRNDKEIKEEIDRLLNEVGQVEQRDIQVDVKDGVVTLSGNVRSPLEMRTAAEIPENVLGVLKVANHLNITL